MMFFHSKMTRLCTSLPFESVHSLSKRASQTLVKCYRGHNNSEYIEVKQCFLIIIYLYLSLLDIDKKHVAFI